MLNRIHRLALLLLVIISLGCSQSGATEVAKIASADASKLVQNKQAVLVDIRESDEWDETGVATPAILLPKSDFDGEQKLWKEFLTTVGNKQIILYCGSGRRAGILGKKLIADGFTVTNAGGLKDWVDAGLPTRKASEPAK